MTVRIDKPVQGGTVKAVASKSEAHRLLICAALSAQLPANTASANGETFIACPERSEDIDATARCLEALGAALRYERDGFFVKPVEQNSAPPSPPLPTPHSPLSIPHSPPRINLNCGESGSTLRFLLPVSSALGLPVSFTMSGRLSERPLSALCGVMASHGCTLSKPGYSPLTCKGRLNCGNYTLPGNTSSQFASGLLFALPLLDGESIIHITGVLESRPYVDMTLDALRLFGITAIEEEAQIFRIPGGQTFCSPGKVTVSGDWSNAAFWLSAGAIGKKAVTCTGLDPDSRQGDRAIVELLARFGAHVTRSNDAVTVSPGALRGTDIDAGDNPDLVPVLAAAASVAEGKTTIRNAGRLRIKESDRLRTIAMSLTSLGADIAETEDGLLITGKKALPGGETESYGDHRIAMTAAVVSAACTGPVVIHDAEAVHKSYPGFFEDFTTALAGAVYLVISK